MSEKNEELLKAVKQAESAISKMKEILSASQQEVDENENQSGQRRSEPLLLKELYCDIDCVKSKYAVPFTVGQAEGEKPLTLDVTELPHLIVGGTTGAGKTMCLKNLIFNQMISKSPQEVNITIIDPRKIEYTRFNGLPHLHRPVCTEMDEIVSALESLRNCGEERLEAMRDASARSFEEYRKTLNSMRANTGSDKDHESKTPAGDAPYHLVILDDTDIFMQDDKEEIKEHLLWLSRFGKLVGIHLVLSTRDPSSNVFTGSMKSNIPARIALQVVSGTNSRLLLNQNGAEELRGNGDMLISLPDRQELIRLQGPLIDREEIETTCEYWKEQAGEQPGKADWDIPDLSEILFAGNK